MLLRFRDYSCTPSMDPVQVPEKRFTHAPASQTQAQDSVYWIYTTGHNEMSNPSFRTIEKFTEHTTIMITSTELAVRLTCVRNHIQNSNVARRSRLLTSVARKHYSMNPCTASVKVNSFIAATHLGIVHMHTLKHV
jgi:hypothetical protein